MTDEPRLPTDAERRLDEAIGASLRRLRAPAPPGLVERVLAAAPRRSASRPRLRRLAVAASLVVAAAVGYVATRPGAIDEVVGGRVGEAEVGEGQAALSALTYGGAAEKAVAPAAEATAPAAPPVPPPAAAPTPAAPARFVSPAPAEAPSTVRAFEGERNARSGGAPAAYRLRRDVLSETKADTDLADSEAIRAETGDSGNR